MRVFAGRTSTGVRGIRLAEGDEVISMSILGHVDLHGDERDAYLKRRRAERADSENGVEETVEAEAGDETRRDQRGASCCPTSASPRWLRSRSTS